MACACEGVAIPMHNTRLAMKHDVVRAEILTFSLRYQPIQHCQPSRDSLLQVPAAKIVLGSTRSFLVQHTGLSGSNGHALGLTPGARPVIHACERSLGFTPPCGPSSPPFARFVVFPGLVTRSFSLWARL